MLLFDPNTQDFEFSHVGQLNIPRHFLQFTPIEGNIPPLDLLEILNYITGYNLSLAEGQTGVLRKGDEWGTQIAEVYDPSIKQNVRQTGDGLATAMTNLIKELFRLHGNKYEQRA